MMLQFGLNTITSSFLGIFKGSAANPHHCHVEKLGFQLALLVVQKSCMLLFPIIWMMSTITFHCSLPLSPANSVEALSKCEITKVLILPTSVIALIMNGTTGAVKCKSQFLVSTKILLPSAKYSHQQRNSPELFLNMNQWVFGVIKDEIEWSTPITCLHMAMFSLWWDRSVCCTHLKSSDLDLFSLRTLEEAVLLNSVVHKLLKPLQTLV